MRTLSGVTHTHTHLLMHEAQRSTPLQQAHSVSIQHTAAHTHTCILQHTPQHVTVNLKMMILLHQAGGGGKVPPPRILHHTVPSVFTAVAAKALLSCCGMKVPAKALAA